MGRLISHKAILQYTCDAFGINETEIYARTRKPKIVEARFVCIYLIRKNIRYSLNDIGEIFGLDHSTVLYAIRKAEIYQEVDEDFKRLLNEVSNKLKTHMYRLTNTGCSHWVAVGIINKK
jgi:chromosomal replication initiator protein